MNKKYLSVVLFGALLAASAGTFTSCKDYDDDIKGLQEQIDKSGSTITDLQTQLTTLKAAAEAAQATADAAKAAAVEAKTAADAAKAAGDQAKADAADALAKAKAAEAAAATAKTEASNEILYKEIKNMCEDIAIMQRKTYELMFKNGWYALEKAETTKIADKYQMLNNEFESLSNKSNRLV